MKNGSVIGFIAIIILIVAVSGCTDNTQNSTNSGNQTMQQNTSDNSSTANVKISSEEAKNIAKKYINQTGATPGDPMLKTDGQKVYIVPIIVNGNPAGEIIIDAQTGENLGNT